MSGQAFLTPEELDRKVASIEREVVKKEAHDFFYRRLVFRSVRILDCWMWAGKPISESALMEALKINPQELKELYNCCPPMKRLLFKYQCTFGVHCLTIMGRNSISNGQKRRWAKGPVV